VGGLIHYITLNLNISAPRQDNKNLLGKFWATNMMLTPAKFQPSSSIGMGGQRGDRRTCDVTPFSREKIEP